MSPPETATEAMYRAAFRGSWLDAQAVVLEHSSLAYVRLTDAGDLALHVAVSRGHKAFVIELIRGLEGINLVEIDGHGNTPFCYAVVSGDIIMCNILIGKHRRVLKARDGSGRTPLYKAAVRGESKMFRFLLEKGGIEHLSQRERFEVLVALIEAKMLDMAISLFEMDKSVVGLTNNDGTLLHAIARLELNNVNTAPAPTIQQTLKTAFGFKTDEAYVIKCLLCALASRIWDGMIHMENFSKKMVSKPSLLHQAAKMGHLYIIKLVMDDYPSLIWEKNEDGHNFFHIAVIHQQADVIKLYKHLHGAMKFLSDTSKDIRGNTILHLAVPKDVTTSAELLHDLKQHKKWFELVCSVVNPKCLAIKDANGETPKELFKKRALVQQGQALYRKIANIGLVTSNILFSAFIGTFINKYGFGNMSVLWSAFCLTLVAIGMFGFSTLLNPKGVSMGFLSMLLVVVLIVANFVMSSVHH